MELRLLTAEADRRAFAHALAEARATKGLGFRETKSSVVGQIHLAFGRLYGVFDERSAEPDQILGGLIMHDLASFAQSYPRPDLTHLRAESILEVGELWSRARGAGLMARRAVAILSGLLQAEVILTYPIAKPWDLTEVYRPFFSPVGDLIEWPYAETLEGEPVWVRALVCQGDVLRTLVAKAWAHGFQTFDHHRAIRFDNPFPIHPTLSKSAGSSQSGDASHANGAA
jgi:hypothetical protein